MDNSHLTIMMASDLEYKCIFDVFGKVLKSGGGLIVLLLSSSPEWAV